MPHWLRYELTQSKYVEKLPAGKHSTKGIGKTAPDPSNSYTTDEGVVIPMGKGMQDASTKTSLLYNEYPQTYSLSIWPFPPTHFPH